MCRVVTTNLYGSTRFNLVAFDVDQLVHDLLLEWDEGRRLHQGLYYELRREYRGGKLGERPTWRGHTAEKAAEDLRRLAGAVPPGARGIILASVWVEPQRLEDFLGLVLNNISQHIPAGPQADRARRVLQRSLVAQRRGAPMSGAERTAKWKTHRRLEPVLHPLLEARSPSGQRPDIPGIPVAAMAQASAAVYPAASGYFTPGPIASVSAMDGRIFIEPVWRPEGGAMLPDRHVDVDGAAFRYQRGDGQA